MIIAPSPILVRTPSHNNPLEIIYFKKSPHESLKVKEKVVK
jgi:hypothetical protein